MLVGIAAAFGRAVAEVGASLMVGGNVLGQTRILTTTIALEAGKGEFALALALGIVLLALAFVVNALLVWLPLLSTVGAALTGRSHRGLRDRPRLRWWTWLQPALRPALGGRASRFAAPP